MQKRRYFERVKRLTENSDAKIGIKIENGCHKYTQSNYGKKFKFNLLFYLHSLVLRALPHRRRG